MIHRSTKKILNTSFNINYRHAIFNKSESNYNLFKTNNNKIILQKIVFILETQTSTFFTHDTQKYKNSSKYCLILITDMHCLTKVKTIII